MAEPTLWWLLAGAVVAVELLTGTFYLLMIAFGLVAAATVAHLGAGVEVQTLAAAVLGGGAVVAWHLKRDRSRTELPAQANAALTAAFAPRPDRAGVRQGAAHWLTTLGLGQTGPRLAPTFSGGERQRIAVARALAANPPGSSPTSPPPPSTAPTPTPWAPILRHSRDSAR